MDYRQMATDAANRHGLPVPLFLRMLQQESSWNPSAVSPKGALGLGQLMPATARELGVDPEDPAQNLEGAARYLRQQYDDFQNWDTALAAYNAGPGNVRKYGGIPPFTETQNYVASIMGGLMQKDLPMNSTTQPLAAPASAPAAQGQLQIPQDSDFWNRLAIGLQGMTLNPNQGLIDINKAAIQNRANLRKANETAQWLQTQGRSDLASAVTSGGLSGADAMKMALTPRDSDQTALVQNYDYATQVLGLDPEQARAWVKSGTSVNIGAGDTALDKIVANQIGTYITGTADARQNMATLDAMEALSEGDLGSSAAWRNWAQNNLGISASTPQIEAFQALVNRMTPSLRPPGSGPMSDADLALFKQSLPALMNSPEGNRAIISGLRMMNEFQIEAGNIANKVLTGELTQQQAILQISQLQPSTSLQALIELPQLMAKEEAGTLTDEERARLIELIRQENGT